MLVKMVQKVDYKVVRTIDQVEIRKYPKLLLATVSGLPDNDAFSILFNYITGANQKNQKVEMTAPVLTSEKIEMTAPVISSENKMSFIMPDNYNISNIPKPKNPQVIIEELPAAKLAVIRFKGHARQKDVNKYIDQLLKVLEQNKIRTQGEPVLMRYNSPFAPGFIRRNEVAIKVLIGK
jgi:effector-binding domain-containing protein